MAKMNKIMPPRNTTIRGQDHLLAYITPEEAQMLMDNGGAGQPGPMGIPAFFDVGEGAGGYDSGGEGDDKAADTAGGAGDPDAGIGGGGSTSGIGGGDGRGGGKSYSDLGMSPGESQAIFGTPEFGGMTKTQAYNTIGTGGGSDRAQQVQADIVSQLTRAGNQGANQFTSVPYVNAQIQMLANQQIQDRMRQADRGYGIPGLFGSALGFLGNTNLRNIAGGIGSGGRAFFGPQGQIQGVFNEGPFGFGEVYTGNVVKGYPETGYNAGGGESGFGDIEQVKPVNPETGQCDEGYMFDEDMQACRLDTGFAASDQTGGGVMAQPGDAYARMGLLDVAPTGLPEFQQQYGAGFGTPSQFADANLAFRQRGAYRPEYFDQPYPTTGYTLLS
jgi:hypothetical protein